MNEQIHASRLLSGDFKSPRTLEQEIIDELNKLPSKVLKRGYKTQLAKRLNCTLAYVSTISNRLGYTIERGNPDKQKEEPRFETIN